MGQSKNLPINIDSLFAHRKCPEGEENVLEPSKSKTALGKN